MVVSRGAPVMADAPPWPATSTTYNIHRGETVDVAEGLEQTARDGAEACPEGAILIED
jgi:ferredoxin